jgi:integrase
MAEELTKELVEAAVGPMLVWDAHPKVKVKGFGLRVHPGGAKSFFLNYRHEGSERRYTIGSYPTWSVTAARERAKEVRRDVDNGHDPASEKRERRTAPTVQDLVDRYIADHLPKKTAKEDREKDELKMLTEIAERIGKQRKVADVHFGDIEAMHRAITDSGRPVRANRILAVASKMFSLALRPRAGEEKPWRDQAQGNPCKGIDRNPETARERFFGAAELAAIGDALAAYDGSAAGSEAYQGSAADCIRLIMLTGCRPSEAILATWDQFDAEAGFWKKPAATTKQRNEHKLAVGAAVLELIERRRQRRKDGAQYVFPGQKPGEPLKQLWHVWNFVRSHAGLAETNGKIPRIYDLRHTFASVGAGGGLSLPIIGRLLGHTQARTTQRYAHLADDPVREAAERIGAVISGAGKPSAKVVAIKG